MLRDRGFLFDGNDAMVIDGSLTLNPNFAILTWVRIVSDLETPGCVVGKLTVNGNPILNMCLTPIGPMPPTKSNPRTQIVVGDEQLILEDYSFEIDHEKWFIFTVVGEYGSGGTTIGMYINNSLVNQQVSYTDSFFADNVSSQNLLGLGIYTGANYFQGHIYNFTLYTKALNTNEMEVHAKTGSD